MYARNIKLFKTNIAIYLHKYIYIYIYIYIIKILGTISSNSNCQRNNDEGCVKLQLPWKYYLAIGAFVEI